MKDGIVTITGNTADPFLGFAAGKLEAGAKLRLRIKSSGGTGKIEWLPGGKPDAATAPPTVAFEITGGDWTEVSAAIPTPGDQPGILRLHLPAVIEPVALDWIELTNGTAKPRRWDF